MNSLIKLSALAAAAVAQDKAAQFTKDFDNLVRTTSLNQSNGADVIRGMIPAGQLVGDRALLKMDMGLLDQYGCWCYFEFDHGSGRGHPIDEIDEFCKLLHDGYSCILIDFDNAGSPCTPWQIPYNSAFGSGIPTGLSLAGLIQECDTNNTPGSCEAEVCKVEGWFIQSYFTYAVNGGTINLLNQHSAGFDVATECPITTGVKSERACCGTFPTRFPFKTYGGDRACCIDHTYDDTMLDCCNDGSTSTSCPP